MMKVKHLLFTLFLAAALPVAAQEEKPDTAFVFRFVPGKDMFFSPWNGNGEAFARLAACIGKNRAAIDAGQMYLLVSSFGTTGSASRAADDVASVRRNRVKSELISRTGVCEANFVTDRVFAELFREAGVPLRDVVVVVIPAGAEKVAEIAGAEAAARVVAYTNKTSVQPAPEPEPEQVAEQPAVVPTPEPVLPVAAPAFVPEPEPEPAPVAETKGTLQRLALHANLLRWATLTPDLGVEWRVCRHVGIVVNGTYTSWCWDGKNRRYALWEIAPEVRWYMGKEKRGYVGAMYKAGAFNYKFSSTGRQGDLMGGGLTGGYRQRLTDALSLDFALGVGYLKADYDKYIVADNVRVRNGEGSKTWWGPTSAGVTLVWTIF